MKFLKLSAILVVLLSGAAASATDADDVAFKARIAACKTERCLINLSLLYFSLWQRGREIEETTEVHARAVLEREMAQMRAQLNNSEFFPMVDDGRWDAMTEPQRQEWIREHLSPPKEL